MLVLFHLFYLVHIIQGHTVYTEAVCNETKKIGIHVFFFMKPYLYSKRILKFNLIYWIENLIYFIWIEIIFYYFSRLFVKLSFLWDRCY